MKMLGNTGPVVASPSQNKQTCICCRIKFDSVELQRCHFKSEWHLYNLKRRVCCLEPIDLDSFFQIQTATPVKDDDELSTFSDLGFGHPHPSTDRPVPDKKIDNNDDSDDDDWEQIDAEELLEEELTEDEVAELLTKVVPSDTCLFCHKKSSSIKDNLAHMNVTHGFFIPEEQYLIDLEGLMDYLGCKVGACSICLWCHKQFNSRHGVRLHMLNKDHCKISYDQDKALKEFKEFYDYSKQEQIQMKPLNQLVVRKKRPARQADQRDLVITTNGLNSQLSCKKTLDSIESCQAKSFKKFESYRAKILLRTSVSNNNTVRARMRRQNPI